MREFAFGGELDQPFVKNPFDIGLDFLMRGRATEFGHECFVDGGFAHEENYFPLIARWRTAASSSAP